MGKRWSEIARRLNNRPGDAVKNWWNSNQNKRKRGGRRESSYRDAQPQVHVPAPAFDNYRIPSPVGGISFIASPTAHPSNARRGFPNPTVAIPDPYVTIPYVSTDGKDGDYHPAPSPRESKR